MLCTVSIRYRYPIKLQFLNIQIPPKTRKNIIRVKCLESHYQNLHHHGCCKVLLLLADAVIVN